MKRLETRKIRNIGIMAHVDAGKTTLSEQLLVKAGRLRAAGRIDDGNTKLDFSPEERDRGITIDSAATCFDWVVDREGYRVHLIDTPGHVDFRLEVERSLRVLDAAVAVFCAVSGVEPQSETVWRQADGYDLPRVAFVNKMDLAGANFERTVAEIAERFGVHTIPVTAVIGGEGHFGGVVDLLNSVAVTAAGFESQRAALMESLANFDEEVLDACLTGEVDDVLALEAVRRLTIARTIVPVLCGTALGDVGVELLLDAVVRYLPSPDERPAVVGEGGVARSASDDEFSGLAFKVVHDEYAGLLTFVRVVSGTLKKGDRVLDMTREDTVRIGRLLLVHADEREEVEQLTAGTVGAVLGLRNCEAGTTLCSVDAPVRFAKIERPEPVVWMSVEPRRSADRAVLGEALAKMTREDPALVVRVDPETGETLVGGLGELHLDVVRTRLERVHGVVASFGEPLVSLRETPKRAIEHPYRLKKQSGGPGMFAQVTLRVAPSERGSGVVFGDSVTGGAISRDFVSAVERGVRSAAGQGVLGHEVTDVTVELVDGMMHANDSSAMAFEMCAAAAFREALEVSGTDVLEPMMRLVLTAPADRVGEVVGELERRRGRVLEIAPDGAVHRIVSRAPLAGLFGLANALRSLTSGRATQHLELDGFELRR